MRRILDFGGNASGGIGRIGDELLDEVDEGKATLSELAYDPETVLVDPNIAGAIDGVVQSIETGERAPHLSLSLCNSNTKWRALPLTLWNSNPQFKEMDLRETRVVVLVKEIESHARTFHFL